MPKNCRKSEKKGNDPIYLWRHCQWKLDIPTDIDTLTEIVSDILTDIHIITGISTTVQADILRKEL